MGLNTVNMASRKASAAKKNEYEDIESRFNRIMQQYIKQMKRIENVLQVKVWVWDKDIGHKLFNFHEGYETLPMFPPLIGSRKSIYPLLILSKLTYSYL